MDEPTRLLIEEVATKAAHQAVSDILESLGFNPHDKLGTQEGMLLLRHLVSLFKDPDFRLNMEYITLWRKAAEDIKKKSFLTLIILFLTGATGALWLGIKAGFHS